ncbi:MAG TPA: phenylalanine--tRNA ligase subunit beta [Candidatus Saccharimonadales bacterium]|nr:phenylalanine--tRNA ligase subunit beta [Candidatus Saccharimonadales bacterium]
MNVSANWLNKYTGIRLDIDELADKIGAQLGAVDDIIDTGSRYKGAVIAKVISAEKHPNADKLSLCLIDDGGAVKDADRNEQGYIQVVCGAPNVAAGQTVVWLPPGAVVPSTFDKDPFVLEARELRGKVSNGMIASAKELAVGDDHTGIVVIEEDVKPGTSFIEAFELDDYIIDIENKMFTHRPDLFGILGVAREVAGITGTAFKSPDWYREDLSIPSDGRKNVLPLSVKNEVPELVPRFMAVALKDVKVAPSHFKLQTYLARVGIRPINNIVDATNFIMHLTGQPVHAYDYDKLGTGILGVRLSKKGEKLTVIGGKEIILDEGAAVITDGQKPVGLGGVMGGAGTEVDADTKNIILECAAFDMNLTRKTSMVYGLFTDAATRFTKGQSPRQNGAVMGRLIQKVQKRAGGRIASELVDLKNGKKLEHTVSTDTGFINTRLGLSLTAEKIAALLSNVEFTVDADGESLKVTPPFWRTDIEIPEDIVEEVGRLYGYDKLPVILPRRDLSPALKNPAIAFKSRLRAILKQAGANEVLTYSFVHENLLKKAGQDPKNAYHIRNALSPNLQYYRLSLTPSLLEKVQPDIKAGFDEFGLFEIGKAHGRSEMEDGLPKQFERLALVLASKSKGQGAAYFWAQNYVQYIGKKLNLVLRFEPLENTQFPIKEHLLFEQMLAVYDLKRAALVYAGDKLAGVVGEFRPETKTALKLPAFCAGAELFLSTMQNSPDMTYQPLHRFPELEQDFTLRSSAELSYQELAGFMAENIARLSVPHGYGFSIRPLDIFQKADDKKHKQTTWRIILWHPERTLTTQETNKLLDEVASKAKQELKAERV